MTGAEGLDRFLYNTADLSSTKVEYVKAVAGFENARSLVSDIKYNEVKYKQARDKATWNSQEDDIFKNFDDPLWDHWRELRPKTILSDIICDGGLLKFVYRVLFVAGGDSIFFLVFIGTILGIGVVFNGLLLIGAHINNVTHMAAWVAYQRFIFILDLILLLITVYYSQSPLLTFIQTLRMIFGLWCIGTVNRNIRSFTSEPKIMEAPVFSINTNPLKIDTVHENVYGIKKNFYISCRKRIHIVSNIRFTLNYLH
ncbi:uncharacterized protein LOC120353519 isoform X2 [Nilaparvata lugens]|nr:uncharacterized protein LOC120353519 isoform X2 [Nilaparvata lugens]